MADAIGPRTGAAPKVIAVAWREFRHTVLTKGFIIGAVAVPAIIFVALFAMALLVNDKDRRIQGTLAILDPSGTVAAATERALQQSTLGNPDVDAEVARVTDAMSSAPGAQAAALAAMRPNIDVTVTACTDPAREEDLRRDVREGRLLGLAVVPASALHSPGASGDGEGNTFTMILPLNSPPRTTQLLQRAVGTGIVEARVTAAGQDYAALQELMARPNAVLRSLSADGAESRENIAARMIAPAGFMLLLWVATFTSGNYLLTSTIEEKSNKVMEVLLSAVSPMQLLLGKILGYSLVSLVMLLSYGGLALVSLAAFSMSGLVQPYMILYMVIYFVMAYLFVATIMVSVGSAVSDLREAQSLVGPAMIVLVIPLMLWLPISDDPNGWLATITSFLPPAIPFVMILRVTASADPIPLWQVVLNMVWGFLWVWIFLWAGAKIFRVGVLMQGKPPTPRELLRWIRMA